MKILVDTNRYRDFCEGLPAVVHIFRAAEEIGLPFVALAELRAGFLLGKAGRQNEAVLNRFIGLPRVRILFADNETTHHYARIFKQLREQGTPIPTKDIWIAALISQHNFHLLTRDTHFDHLPQLPLVQL